MSKWAHEMALKTYEDLQKKNMRKAEGVKQANSYMYENMNHSRGIRTRRKNGGQIVTPQY